MFSLILVENGIYYIRYYVDGSEGKGIGIRLNREEFMAFVVGKVEK